MSGRCAASRRSAVRCSWLLAGWIFSRGDSKRSILWPYLPGATASRAKPQTDASCATPGSLPRAISSSPDSPAARPPAGWNRLPKTSLGSCAARHGLQSASSGGVMFSTLELHQALSGRRRPRTWNMQANWSPLPLPAPALRDSQRSEAPGADTSATAWQAGRAGQSLSGCCPRPFPCGGPGSFLPCCVSLYFRLPKWAVAGRMRPLVAVGVRSA